jgi:hypothetical protein
MSLLNSVLDRIAAERIFNFLSRIGRNSGSPEYCFRQQLFQLSVGLSNGSKRLAIHELQQSETQSVAESSFLYKTGFWRNLAMTSPEISYTKNVANEVRFPLVTHMTRFDIQFGRYGFLKSGYGAELILDRLM